MKPLKPLLFWSFFIGAVVLFIAVLSWWTITMVGNFHRLQSPDRPTAIPFEKLDSATYQKIFPTP